MGLSSVQVQKIEIEDRPGALEELFAGFTGAEANVLNIAAFSAGGGKGAAFVIADKPAVVDEFARSKGMVLEEYAGFLLSGRDQIGVGAKVTSQIAESGVNIRVFTATVIEAEYRVVIVVDKADEDKVGNALGAS